MNIKVDWKEWNLGEKVIFASACAAVLSLFMPWVDMGIASRNGFGMFWGIILLLAFAYPLKYIMSKEVFNINLALGLAGISSVFCLYILISKHTPLLFIISVPKTGSWVGILLVIKCIKRERVN